jgi:DNA-binding transcriptional regulator LsrR (DeoR family)
MTNDDMRLMIKVARLYYETGLTQKEISDRLRLSRPTISRIINEARRTGIVQFQIAQLQGVNSDLEREVETRFNLSEVIVAEVPKTGSQEDVARELGREAADYFSRSVRSGDVIGFTWGETLACLADSLPIERRDIVVAQMVGGMGDPSKELHSTDIVMRISQKMGASMSLIPAPGIVDTVEQALVFRSERTVEQAIQTARSCDLVFAGLGSVSSNSTYMRGQAIITWDELELLRSLGAVGNIGLHFFDREGALVGSEFDRRIVGVDLGLFRDLKRVVVVAGGSEKHEAVLAGVRGGFAKILITDEGTARFLIEKSD